MKNIKTYILALCVGAMSVNAAAQVTTRSAYFLEGNSFRHQLNPAFSGERNYISMPALGNFNLGVMSNVGVNTFLYKLPGGNLTTFMNKSVSADEFLGKIKDNNNINLNTNITLLSAGFRGFGGFNTITVSARQNLGVNLPKGLFEFMKLGQTGPDTQYDFSDLGVRANVAGEVALGHSRRINSRLEVGAKVKVLVGVGSVDAKIDNMQVRMADNKWSIRATGSMDMAAGTGLYLPTKREAGKEYDTPSEGNEIEWGDLSYDSFSLSGMGFGVDLGATYQLLPDLKLSAAVLDLGVMNWKNNIKAKTPDTSWTFDGFDNIALDSSQPGYENNKLGEQFDAMWDDLEEAINFHKESADGSRSTPLAATIHLGAEYTMPFYRGLTGGFLYTSHLDGAYSWHEGRFSANVKPTKWFDASINYALSSFGSSFGWMVNFHPCGFNLFVGTDHQFFKVTPQYVPVGNACAQLTLGMNFTFGSRKI